MCVRVHAWAHKRVWVRTNTNVCIHVNVYPKSPHMYIKICMHSMHNTHTQAHTHTHRTTCTWSLLPNPTKLNLTKLNATNRQVWHLPRGSMTHHVLFLTTRRILLFHLHLSQQLKIYMPCPLRLPGPKCIGILREYVLYIMCSLDRYTRLGIRPLQVLQDWLRLSAL